MSSSDEMSVQEGALFLLAVAMLWLSCQASRIADHVLEGGTFNIAVQQSNAQSPADTPSEGE